ncbi:MAG: hypothetical protein KDC92_03865 [Bacteroidetes bacterium]|nr:hypothetical protein [Bacteroidota bacterium]
MFKKYLLHGILGGIGAFIACVVWTHLYTTKFYLIDFSPVISTNHMLATCIFVCVLASIGLFALDKFLPKFSALLIGIVFSLISIASLGGVATYDLTQFIEPILAIESNFVLEETELLTLFPIYSMPMHFFPALAWFALKPLFFKSNL